MTDATATCSITCSIVHHSPGRLRLRLPGLNRSEMLANSVQQSLEQTSGIQQIRLNRAAQCFVVHYHPDCLSPGQILDQVTAVERDPMSPPVAPSASAITSPTSPPGSDSFGAALAPSLLAAALAWLSGRPRLAALRPLALLSLLVAVFPTAQRAWESVRDERRLNIDGLDLLALSLGAWQGRLLTPALTLTLHELGDGIRQQTARRTEVQTADLRDTIGRFAWVQGPGEDSPGQVPSDRVPVEARVIVYPGEQIPVDGTVLRGEATIDQQGLTGEAMPVVRRPGDRVWASTLVRSGQLELRAERVGAQTRAAASLDLLRKAPVQDTRMANYAAKVADRLIWPSLLLAGITLATSRNPARAAAILTLDFVTGIRVSIPTAFLGALNHTTRHGILVRSGRTLEGLAEVDTLVFDKTGTLTQGTIAIAGVRSRPEGLPAERVLQLAAAAEQQLTHPLAEALVRYSQEQGLSLPVRDHWSYDLGLGVEAEIEGQLVWVGSQRFLQEAGVDWCGQPQGGELLKGLEGESLIYVACDRRFQGVIHYTDPLRPESQVLLERLQHLYGIEIYLLTGDHPRRAAEVAQQLGIPPERVQAEAFPEDKARMVRELHRSGRTVAFVGDGLNDSVALAYADVSVSFAQGSEIARETADVVLMNDCLTDLLQAIAISRQTRSLIEQNIALVVGPNLAALGLATTVGLNPLLATAIHNGSAIAAGLNSLRPLVVHQLHWEPIQEGQ
jgi:Cu2+-exporting ATPase